MKTLLVLLASLLLAGCEATPPAVDLLTEEQQKHVEEAVRLRKEAEKTAEEQTQRYDELKRLWTEANKIAVTIRQELGCEAFSCSGLDPQASVYVTCHEKKATDAMLERLGKMPRIGHLDIAGGSITDAGLEHLKGLTQLQFLDVHNTNITDAGSEYLSGLAQLKWLYLGGTRVTADGVNKLQHALPKCNINWAPPTPDDQERPTKADQPGR